MNPNVLANSSTWVERVSKAIGGDETSWRSIVDDLSGVVWKVLNTFDLNAADREDAFASTFFRLFDKIATVRDPSYLPGWVATAARNEARAISRSRARTIPTADLGVHEFVSTAIDESLLDNEMLVAVMKAFASLPAESQALLRLLTTVPALSYQQIGGLLNMPKGSIGPTAGRVLDRLRRELTTYVHGDVA